MHVVVGKRVALVTAPRIATIMWQLAGSTDM
jgi:hypothetical protein